jgi:hypothetical protein
MAADQPSSQKKDWIPLNWALEAKLSSATVKAEFVQATSFWYDLSA